MGNKPWRYESLLDHIVQSVHCDVPIEGWVNGAIAPTALSDMMQIVSVSGSWKKWTPTM